MAEKKDYINLSVEELQDFIEIEFKDSLFSYPISMMKARAGIYLETLEDGSLYLDTLNIRPELQGKGVGSEILAILKEWAIANGKAVYIKPAYLSDNPYFKGVELSPEEQVDNLFNFYKKNGWEDNPNFTALSEQEQAAQLSLSSNREWGVEINDIYSPLVFIPEGVEVPELPKNPYLDNMISFAEKFNKEGKVFLDGYNQPILDEVLEEILKLEMYFGVSGFMEESEWEKSELRNVAIELDSQGIHPNDVGDISEYIPRDKILTPAEIFKEGKRNEFFTDGIVKLLSEAGGSFYKMDEDGDELFPENRPKRDYELYYAISGKDEAENMERISVYKNKHHSVMEGPPKSLKWIEYTSKGDRPIPSIDTPTNVVDDGIELYHSRAKGVDLPDTDKGLHAGTYNAALDKAAMQYNNINFYNWAFDAQEKIAIAHNNGIDIVADMIQGELEDLTEGNSVPIEHQEAVYIEWVTGEETEYIIYFEGEISLEDGEYINDLKANLYTGDMDGFRGDLILELDTDLQYANVQEIANNPDIAKISKSNSKLLRPGIDTQYATNSLDIAENLLENIGTGYSFSGERGYDLYKVSIKPNAKILELPGEIVLQINGSDVTWTADELQNTLIDTDSSQVTEIENIKIGDKTIEIPDEARRKDVSKLLFGDYDVITYKNQGEDVGSTSYLFKDSNSYTIEKIDDVKFNDDVNKKFYGTNKYDYYSDKANEFKDPSTFKKYQVNEYNPNLTFTDTPTNVVDNVDEFPSLETRFKIETIDPDDYASPGDKYDLVTGWEDDVITPNKVFNPDQFTILNEQGLPVFTPQGKEIYQRILSGTATDEDITKFFIYLVTHSPAPAYTFASFNKPDALADIIKIGIFSDRPLSKIIPFNSGLLQKQFFDKLLSRNKNIKIEEIVPIILDIVQENGQFENIRDKMRNVLLNAHNEIYSKNSNDYFVLWRGGDLNRTFPWQSMTKRMEAAQDVASQMNGIYGSGIETSSYVLHKNNFIDLDALGLSYMNEQEIIVFTKAALAKGAKRPTPVNNPGKAKDILEWWLLAKESKDMFPKNGVDMTNISQYVDDSGQATQQFFSDVINGIDPKYRPSQQYEPIIEITNEKLLTFQNEYNNAVKNGGNFNQHIFTSIPTFYEAQIIKGQALINLLNNAYPNRIFSFEQGLSDGLYDFKLLDIGGTEGTWSSTIAALEPRIQVTVLDPNRDAEKIFNKNTLVNKQFQLGAFSHNKEDFGKYFDETGVMFIKPNRQYDIVHESMAFQFIDADRTGQIEFIKNEVLKEDGILFIEEKFLDNDTIYQANENLKNEFKLQYYTEEQLSNKKFNVLLNMEGKQAAISDVEAALNNNFKYVVQYWDSGNFKGFVASNNEKVLGFVDEINALNTSLTNHRFSTAPTDKEIKGSIQNISNKTNTSKEIAKDIITNTVAENPAFFNNIQNILGDIGNKIKKFSLSATSIGLTGLAKVTPALAPGDVIIEKTLEKVIPYLDEASAKLGFARLPWNKILPTYIATEIGIAMADTVQAAMYAYEEAAKNKQPTKLEEVLTKAFLPKSYEEEALEKMNRRASHMNDLFFNTPTGKEVVKSMDFGSAFLRELDKEKISKYSPGWSLTKSIFTMLGTAYQNTKNPSDYSTKLKDNPAMIYNAGFTGNNKWNITY